MLTAAGVALSAISSGSWSHSISVGRVRLVFSSDNSTMKRLALRPVVSDTPAHNLSVERNVPSDMSNILKKVRLE